MTETPKIDKFELQPHHSVRPFAITQVVLFALTWGVLELVLWMGWLRVAFDLRLAAFVGVGFAQISLAAAWFALGPFRMVVRSFGAATLATIAYLAVAWRFRTDGPGPLEAIVVGLLCGYLGAFVAVQVPLWLFRYWLGLSVVHLTELQPEDSNRGRQFTIRELLASTTIIVIVLAIGRGVILSLSQMDVASNRGPDLNRMIYLFLMMAGFNLLLVWPAIGAVLMPRGQILTVPIAVCISAVATYLEGPMFSRIFGGPGPDIFWFFVYLNGPQYLLIVLSLTITRWFGYVLVRTPR